MRKIAPFTLLHSCRIFENAPWIDRAAHIHDHHYRSPQRRRATAHIIANQYLE
jgi:hypothetical protein